MFVVLVFIYCLLFEWRVFDWHIVKLYTVILKFCIPLALFYFIMANKSKLVFPSGIVSEYFFILLVFQLWMFVPSFFSADSYECILQCFKYCFRFVFFVSILLYFYNYVDKELKLLRLLVFVGVFSVLQFFILQIFWWLNMQGEPISLLGAESDLYGPMGMLGYQQARMYFSGFSGAILRLTGYWLEPSNASGFLFCFAFIAYGFFERFKIKKMFTWASTCFVGGILCLSLAGYLACGASLLLGCCKNKEKSGLKSAGILVFGCALMLIAIFGRSFVVNTSNDNVFLKAVTGVRENVAEYSQYSVSGGRFDLLKYNFQLSLKKPLGVGVYIPGEAKGVKSFRKAFPGALVYWLAVTGYIGVIMLLLVVFLFVRIFCVYDLSRWSKRLFQGWFVLLIQQSVYGYWMSPLILMLGIFFLVSCQREQVAPRFKSINYN